MLFEFQLSNDCAVDVMSSEIRKIEGLLLFSRPITRMKTAPKGVLQIQRTSESFGHVLLSLLSSSIQVPRTRGFLDVDQHCHAPVESGRSPPHTLRSRLPLCAYAGRDGVDIPYSI